ncbi:MAG: TerC family protein [Glaciimonas sp.]|nr:TerC family protein [Glaciimonas sp.]
MEFDGVMHALGMVFQVFLLDLILSGDNAVVIALACRSLPPQQMRKVILIGTGTAIFLRVILTTVITYLLSIPSLRLIGGLVLIYIAIKLIMEEEAEAEEELEPQVANDAITTSEENATTNKMWSTVGIVVIADLVMSVDNVVALAAAVQGSVFFLVLGLLFSVPLLMYGSLYVTKLLNRYPILVPAVGALLGWIAGDISMSDPLIANWVNTQSPALAIVMPLLCAVFVLLQSKILKENRHNQGVKILGQAPKAPLSSLILSMNEPPSVAIKAKDVSSNFVPKSASEQSQPNYAAQIMVVENGLNIPAKNSQITSTVMTKAPEYPWHKQLPFSLPGLKRSALIVAAISIVLIVFFLFSYFSKNFMPVPGQLVRYDCPGFRGIFSLYYKQGGEEIQIRSNGNVIDGVIHYGKIDWKNYNDASAAVGFMPPQEIVSYAKSVQINGGNFVEIMCPRIENP